MCLNHPIGIDFFALPLQDLSIEFQIRGIILDHGVHMLTASFMIITVGMLGWFLLLWRAIFAHKQIPDYSGTYPSVTVIRPVKGLDVGAKENFSAGLKTGYPGKVETIFVFDSDDDPAFSVAKEVVDAHNTLDSENPASIILVGSPPKGRTGKLHAMIVAENLARGEIIAFNDSDTRPDKNILRVLVETLLTTPNAGAAFVPVVSDQPIRKSGDVFYALLQNSLYAPWALFAAGKTRTLPFIMGQYMVISRECLAAIGGVACASGQLVDDMYIGKCVHNAGFTNVVAPYSLSIHSNGLSFKEFLPIYKKWFQFGKNGLPISFLWKQWAFGTAFYLLLAGMILSLAFQDWGQLAVCLTGLGVYSFGLIFVNEAYGGAKVPLRYFWTPVALLLSAIIIVLANRLNNKVQWRGREYIVDGNAALKEKAQTVTTSP